MVDIISCTAKTSCKAERATQYRTLLKHGHWLIIQLKYAGLGSEHYPVTSARLSYDGDLESLATLCEWAVDIVSSKQFTMFAEIQCIAMLCAVIFIHMCLCQRVFMYWIWEIVCRIQNKVCVGPKSNLPGEQKHGNKSRFLGGVWKTHVKHDAAAKV